MLHIRRVLYPTDRSELADRAFPHAVHLAGSHEAELHVVHVTEDPAAERPDLVPHSWDDAYANLHVGVDDRPTAPAERAVVQRQVNGDDAAEGILRYADDEAIDVIVLGTHGRGGVKRMLLGSVAEKVVREAPCPVLTVRESAPRPIDRILVPVDFSDRSKAVIPVAQALAEVYGSRIELLYVIDAEDLPLANAPLLGPVHVGPEEVEKRIHKLMNELVREHAGDVPIDGRVMVGDPARGVLDHAASNADLIVMATHGRTGLKRLLMGSVAEKVVRQAACPVFTVKSFGRDPLAAR